MGRHRDFVTRAEADQLFEEWGRAFVKAVLEILTGPGAGAAAEQRRRQLDEGVDPGFRATREAVRKAIANPRVDLAGFGGNRGRPLSDIPLGKVSDDESDVAEAD